MGVLAIIDKSGCVRPVTRSAPLTDFPCVSSCPLLHNDMRRLDNVHRVHSTKPHSECSQRPRCLGAQYQDANEAAAGSYHEDVEEDGRVSGHAPMFVPWTYLDRRRSGR